MESDEIARQVAIQSFNCLGYMPTRERMSYSILATAWATGFPKPAPERGIESDNPWSLIPIQYHLEEAIIFRFWAMQAELLYGYITKIMRMSEAELSLPVTAAGLQPIHILRGMTQLLLDRAQRRAGAVNSPGSITPERVIAIYNSRVLTYEALVSAAAQNNSPIPVENFQLGLSRKHPWTQLLCYCAENLLSTLTIDDDTKAIATPLLEIATSKTQTGLFVAIQKLS